MRTAEKLIRRLDNHEGVLEAYEEFKTLLKRYDRATANDYMVRFRMELQQQFDKRAHPAWIASRAILHIKTMTDYLTGR